MFAGRMNSPTSNPAKKILVVDDEKAMFHDRPP